MTKDLFCGLPGKKRRSECDCSLQTAKIKKKRLSCSHRPTLRTAWLSSSSCSPQATLETSRLHPFSECSILNQGVTLLLDSLTLNLSVSHQQTLPKAILQTLVRSQRAATLGRRVKRVEGFKTMQSFGTQNLMTKLNRVCLVLNEEVLYTLYLFALSLVYRCEPSLYR